eukprot:gene28094-36259_t
MAKAKGKIIALKLLSTAGTGFFYVTTKNVRNVPQKLNLMKWARVAINRLHINLKRISDRGVASLLRSRNIEPKSTSERHANMNEGPFESSEDQ